MDVRGINRTSGTGTGARRSPAEAETESRALTVQDGPAVRPVNRVASYANPNRRDSAFLAHLALQYDEKSAQSRRIKEQRALAISAYATGHPGSTASSSRARRGVKV